MRINAVDQGIMQNAADQHHNMKKFMKTENTRKKPRGRTVFRLAVCAACAFTVLLGVLSFYNPDPDGSSITDGNNAALSSPSYHFGLVAYAADLDETFIPKDNKIAFSIANSGGMVLGKGDYTGCLFRVTGEGIQTISASINRGGLYRYKKLTNLTEDDIKALYAAEANGILKADCQFASMNNDGSWYSEQMKALGSSFSENWTADASYGFWLPPETTEQSAAEDIKKAAHNRIDTFNGATFTVTVTFQNGSQQTETLHLKTGKLKVVYGKDNTLTVLPELATGDDPYVYSIYAELEN